MKKTKGIISIIIAFVIVISSFMITGVAASGIIFGDVNDDGLVNPKDSLSLKQYIANWGNEINFVASDVNLDKNVNSKDSLLLRQHLADWDVELGVKVNLMRNITSTELLNEITLGINIGNTLDSVGMGYSASVERSETYWGNPQITEQLIQMYKEAGFNAIRLPVSWRNHFAAAPDYEIQTAWLDRVQQVVDMILDNDLYCIVNTHHEQNWLNTNNDKYDITVDKMTAIWTQIADRFKGYGDYLLFEGFNEILKKEGDWSRPSATDIENCNKLGQLFVDVVRATGGNNKNRHLIVSTYGAGAGFTNLIDFKAPTDTVEDRLIVEVHIYDPIQFTFSEYPSDKWGTDGDKQELEAIIVDVNEVIVQQGYPVIIGEFGAVDKNNESYRAEYCKTMVAKANEFGIKCFYWDDGGSFSIFNRRTYENKFPQMVDAMLEALE